MLLYVFILIVATLNLAVGYALGAGLTLGALIEMLPARRVKAKPVDLEDDAPLSRRPEATAAEPPPASEPAAAPAAAATEAAPAETAPSKPRTSDVMAGLAAFRKKLATASDALSDSVADPEQFEANASVLQEANHAYLEEAEGAIKQLEEMGAAGDQEASATCDVVTKGTDRVAQISGEIDGMIESGLDNEEARQKLVEKSTEIHDAVDEVEAAAEANSPTFESIDALFDKLEAALEGAESEKTEHVAALQIDPIEGQEEIPELVSMIEQAVEGLVGGVLEEAQTFVRGKPAFVHMAGESLEEASTRLERIRQQVAAATFSTSAGEFKATLTCALTDAKPGSSRDQLTENLGQALEESSRQGTNRSYHHDGAFPTVIPEKPIKVEPQTISLG